MLGLFLATQLIGLFVTNHYINKGLPYNIERPRFNEETSFLPIFIIILIGTLIAFIIAKFRAIRLWKVWFFVSVWVTMLISFSVFFNQNIALVIALVLAFFKTFKTNVYLHNFTELFIYGGLAAIFVPILNLFSISILLILIAIYDMIAVWKTKHMVKLAKFQSETQLFAGLLVTYGKKGQNKAILGGGDIGFPLLFLGVILSKYGYIEAIIASVIVTLSLLFLLLISKKDRFYPAMPFLAAGCFIGLLIVSLI